MKKCNRVKAQTPFNLNIVNKALSLINPPVDSSILKTYLIE